MIKGSKRGFESRGLLGGLSPSGFLKRHWQKRPLLVRGAFPGFRDPVTPDELAGLSCEEGVESRLVMERGGPKPWSVTHGPQSAARLRRLPKTHWTLLVQGVDRFVPGAAALLESFRFIPDWRVDDVMVSFAPKQGTVGPHVDGYDVFLLQGRGRRRWRIDTRESGEMRPGLDLRILKRFRPEREWVLEPGDMLYLPPGVAHHGVALEDCLTYSIGFRAPSAMDLLAAALPRLVRKGVSDQLYRDPGLRPALHPGEIPRAAVRDLRRLMEKGLSRLEGPDFDGLLGEFLTEPKDPSSSFEGNEISPAALRVRLKAGSRLTLSPGSRLAYIRSGTGAVLFVDGQRYPLSRGLAFAAPLLAGRKSWDAGTLAPHMKKKGFPELLASLAGGGGVTLGRAL